MPRVSWLEQRVMDDGRGMRVRGVRKRKQKTRFCQQTVFPYPIVPREAVVFEGKWEQQWRSSGKGLCLYSLRVAGPPHTNNDHDHGRLVIQQVRNHPLGLPLTFGYLDRTAHAAIWVDERRTAAKSVTEGGPTVNSTRTYLPLSEQALGPGRARNK